MGSSYGYMDYMELKTKRLVATLTVWLVKVEATALLCRSTKLCEIVFPPNRPSWCCLLLPPTALLPEALSPSPLACSAGSVSMAWRMPRGVSSYRTSANSTEVSFTAEMRVEDAEAPAG